MPDRSYLSEAAGAPAGGTRMQCENRQFGASVGWVRGGEGAVEGEEVVAGPSGGGEGGRSQSTTS